MFRIDPDAGTILLASGLTSHDINVTHHLTITATDAGSQRWSSNIDLCVRVVEMAVDDQPKPVMRQGNRLLNHLVLSRSLLIIVVLLGVLGTVFLLFSVICLIRRFDTRRRQGFKRPPCTDDKYHGQGQYNCRMAALTIANGNRLNSQNHIGTEDSEWSQLDQRLALKSARHCDENNDIDSRYKSVIRALESSPRRQLNGDCRQRSLATNDNTKVMTTFGGTMSRHSVSSSARENMTTEPPHQRYQVTANSKSNCLNFWSFIHRRFLKLTSCFLKHALTWMLHVSALLVELNVGV